MNWRRVVMGAPRATVDRGRVPFCRRRSGPDIVLRGTERAQAQGGAGPLCRTNRCCQGWADKVGKEGWRWVLVEPDLDREAWADVRRVFPFRCGVRLGRSGGCHRTSALPQ